MLFASSFFALSLIAGRKYLPNIDDTLLESTANELLCDMGFDMGGFLVVEILRILDILGMLGMLSIVFSLGFCSFFGSE